MSLENPCSFLLAKEKTWKCVFNTNSEILQNLTEKQIIPFKTTVNRLFNDIWCYLVIGCFDWKIAVFQQAVVRVYYILKYTVHRNWVSKWVGLFIMLFPHHRSVWF